MACAFLFLRSASAQVNIASDSLSFNAGFTQVGCLGVSYWVHVKGTCTYLDTTPGYLGGPTWTLDVDRDQYIHPGYNSIFNASESTYMILKVYMGNLTISTASGCPPAWSPVVLPMMNEFPGHAYSEQGFGAGFNGHNFAGFYKPGADCSSGADTAGCGETEQVENPNYTNNTSAAQSITGLPGQTTPLILQPGQSLQPIVTSENQPWGYTAAPIVTGNQDLNGNSINYGDFTNQNGVLTQINNDYGINSPTQMNFGGSAALLGSETNLGGQIVWDNGDGGAPAQDSTLRAGFQAEAEGQALANKLLLSIDNKTTGGSGSNLVSVAVTVTNAGGSGGTNIYGTASNVWVMNWPSNLFAGGTNIVQFPTNSGDTSWTNGTGLAHTWSDAVTAAGTSAGPLGTAIAGLSTLTAPDVSGSAGDPHQQVLAHTPNGDFTFDFNFISDVNWSPVFGLLRQLWVFVLTGFFIWKVGEEIWSGTKQVLAMQGLRVQPLEVEAAGFGGNVAGFGLSVLMVVAILAGIAAFITALVAGLETALGAAGGLSGVIASMTGNPFAGASGGVAYGLSIVFLCFPVGLAVTLFVSSIAFRYLKITVAVPICVAFRILPG